MKKVNCLPTLLLITLVLSACGGGGMYTSAPEPEKIPGGGNENLSVCSKEAPCPVSITRNAFIFGGDFPADIVIPSFGGEEDTAFVATSSTPAGVIAIDLTKNPLKVSTKYASFASPAGTGYPSALSVRSETRAFLLTSSHVLDFNPTTGTVNWSLQLNYKVTLDPPRPSSDGAAQMSEIIVAYPNSVIAANDMLYITTSNYINPGSPASAAPGTILVFDILDADPFLKPKTFIVTTGYNPSGITDIGGGKIAVTNSGVSDLVGSHAEPVTEGSIDIVDTTTNGIVANIPIGMAGLSFQEMAVTSDRRYGYIGSISYGEVYKVDLLDKKAVYDHSDPITLTGNSVGSDYLTSQVISPDDKYLYVASFENSAVYPVDISADPPAPLPGHFSEEPFGVGFPAGVTEENPSGANTGAGPMAIRTGFPDIFVLTGYPGTLVAIATNYSGKKLDENLAPPPGNPPPAEVPPGDKPPVEKLSDYKTEPCQGFAAAVASIALSADGGYNSSKLPGVVLGPPEPPATEGGEKGTFPAAAGVISLGSGGSIVLDMGECAIVDGTGPDLTVFENAFFIPNAQAPSSEFPQIALTHPESFSVWAEGAAVGVSWDNKNFIFFPCDPHLSLTPVYDQAVLSGCAGVTPTLYGRDPLVAGLEEGAGGDSFDLADIGVTRARYVKIVSLGEFKPARQAQGGNTGFDLDAVAVVNGEK